MRHTIITRDKTRRNILNAKYKEGIEAESGRRFGLRFDSLSAWQIQEWYDEIYPQGQEAWRLRQLNKREAIHA